MSVERSLGLGGPRRAHPDPPAGDRGLPRAQLALEAPLGPAAGLPGAPSEELHPFEAELAALKDRLATTAEISDGELAALRSLLAGVDLAAVQRLRRRVERLLPPWRKARVPQACRGPATVDKLIELLGGPGRLGRLAPERKRLLRELRAANLEALIARAALGLVNGDDGLFAGLNPGDDPHPQGFRVELRGKRADHIDQRYALLAAVAALERVGYEEVEIREMARLFRERSLAHGTGADRAQQAVQGFLAEAEARVALRSRRCDELPGPPDLDHHTREELAHRLSQVRWLESQVSRERSDWQSGAPANYKDDLRELLCLATTAELLEALDLRFERVMDYALAAQLRAARLSPLPTVRVERLPAERAGSTVPVAGLPLPADHPVRAQLGELASRLARGETSAVGQAYATRTFPEEILERVASGELKVLAFDGTRENGVRYLRERYGRTPQGLLLSCRLMGLQGVYGSYPRTLVTFDDGQQFLLLSGFGSSRQLNNAGALQLYQSDSGARVRVDSIELAADATDFLETVRQDLRQAIRADWGARAGQPDSIPTRLVILQNPAHLAQLFGDAFRWGAPPESSLVPLHLGYRRYPDGREERVIVPKVGGGGLYGDTAGQFVTAFFTSGLARLVPHVLLNGTAGGFAGTATEPAFRQSRGLPAIEPGGLIMPLVAVAQHGGTGGELPIPSLLGPEVSSWPAELRAAAQRARVHFTSRHVAISAPVMETLPLIQELVDAGYASVDVEAYSVMEATRRLGKTCTAVYTHSDDPRASAHDPNATLGMTGPFLEGSRYHPELFELLRALWDVSAVRAA